MAAFIIRRLFFAALVLVAVSMLVFAVTAVLPGNVANLILGSFAQPAQVHALELKLGLNLPLPEQYWRWASGVLSGDLGRSTIMDRPVWPLLRAAIERSAILAITSFVLVAVIGLGLGVAAALRRNRPLDHAVSIGTFLGIAVPEFFWAIVVILVFAGWLGWLPSSGYENFSAGFATAFPFMIAPVLTLVFSHLAHVSRLTRSSMIGVLGSPYVIAARAKGLPERVVVLRHALRNALMPSVTVLAMDFGRLMGGIVVVEIVFAWPGLGRLLIFFIQNRDIPTLQASLLVIAAIYALANLAADLICALLDKRVRDAQA
jgi:peptide/nickel transport system permease protein